MSERMKRQIQEGVKKELGITPLQDKQAGKKKKIFKKPKGKKGNFQGKKKKNQ